MNARTFACGTRHFAPLQGRADLSPPGILDAVVIIDPTRNRLWRFALQRNVSGIGILPPISILYSAAPVIANSEHRCSRLHKFR